ncbi:MAG: hypothetical protein QOK05_2283 [Chloroflexota bacterium]|jgi:hypothetical protein|nr:hypothetical protein [Chloroflexota bacterium]
MAQLPPPAPSPSSPEFHGPGGRRVLLLFSIGAIILVAGFLIFAGAEALYLVRNGKAQVTDTLPSNLPKEFPVCPGFIPAHTIVVDTSTGKHYDIQGDCPENRPQLVDDLTQLMASAGWTVHNDGTGDLSAYFYDKHERLDVALVDSNNASNQTTISMQIDTGVLKVPSDFPPLEGSPSASPSPR